MHLNHTIEHLSDLISQVSLSDEGKIIRKIFAFAHHLLHKIFDANYLFFYEFFDLLGQVNGSDCSDKPKFG